MPEPDAQPADAIRALSHRHLVEQTSLEVLRLFGRTFGARPLDLKNPGLRPGDKMAVPYANTDAKAMEPETTALLEIFTAGEPGWLSVWDQKTGAGFYAASAGPLPFAFGLTTPEHTAVYQLKPVVAK